MSAARCLCRPEQTGNVPSQIRLAQGARRLCDWLGRTTSSRTSRFRFHTLTTKMQEVHGEAQARLERKARQLEVNT